MFENNNGVKKMPILITDEQTVKEKKKNYNVDNRKKF